MLDDLITKLSRYTTLDDREGEHLQKIDCLLRNSSNPFERDKGSHHVTSSAIAVDEGRQWILLIFHSKLNRWLQPGGHIEIELDSTVEEAARRELMEEACLSVDNIRLIQPEIFDLDVHDIPNGKCERHYDIRFLYELKYSEQFNNSHIRWVGAREIEAGYPESLARFARKVLQLKS